MAHPKVITEEIKAAIVQGLYKGEKMRELCERLSVGRSTVADEERRDPLFGEAVRAARETRVFDLAEDLVTMADKAESMIEVQRLRLKADNIKFVASKLAPKTFGDNLNVNVTATIDLSKVLNAADQRVLSLPQHQERSVIDVSPLENDELTTGFKPVAESFDDLL